MFQMKKNRLKHNIIVFLEKAINIALYIIYLKLVYGSCVLGIFRYTGCLDTVENLGDQAIICSI